MLSRFKSLVVAGGLAFTACGSGGSQGMMSKLPPLEGEPGGFVTYMVESTIFRHPARVGATPVNLTEQLDALSTGIDRFVAVSKNGMYLTMETTRFGCNNECLAVVPGDMSEGELVLAGNAPVNLEGRAAISNDGNLIVYAGRGGPHNEDIFATRRSGDSWSAPTLLSGDSPENYNNFPVMREDGSSVLFDCGSTPFSQDDTSVCEVATDGSAFRIVIAGANNPLGGSGGRAHHADYFKDGSIVFEGEWNGEEIWVLRPDATVPTLVKPDHTNDNSPCVLPGGFIASLWLGRPGAQGFHELKMMSPDGKEFSVLTPDVDVADVGISCHGPTS